jgi:hypothetical protein
MYFKRYIADTNFQYLLLFHATTKYQEKDIQMLKAKSLDVEGAKQFLQKNGNTSLTGIFVAVKAHHIRSTLVPFVDTLPKVSSIILLLKLSVNVAINGLLARVALRDWYSSHGTLPVRRITNKEVLPELPLAQSIARLTLHCAASIKKNENNYLLQKAVKNDEAARRVESTIFKVLDNVCSTVVDIGNGRVTEREALFSMLLEELPQLPEAKESVSIHLHEASLALQEINDMLASWDNHIIP